MIDVLYSYYDIALKVNRMFLLGCCFERDVSQNIPHPVDSHIVWHATNPLENDLAIQFELNCEQSLANVNARSRRQEQNYSDDHMLKLWRGPHS